MSPMQKTHTRELTRIEQLLDTYNFKEALQAVETLEQRDDLSPPDRLTCHLLKSQLLNNMGRYKETLKLTEAIIRECQRQRKRLHRIDALIARAEALGFLGRFKEGLDAIEQGEHELAPLARDQPAEIPHRKAALMLLKGYNYLSKGEIDGGLDYCQQSLIIFKKLGHKKDIADSLCWIGWAYRLKGELNQAMEYMEQSLALAKELGLKPLIAATLNNLGFFYKDKGELDRALEYLERSLALQEELGRKRAIAAPLANIGEICILRDELDRAMAYLEQSLVLSEELSDNFGASEVLYYLIFVAINKALLERAQRYLQRLQQINEQEDNKVISQWCRLAEALVLKTSPRPRHRGKAEELLEQVVNEEIVNHELTVKALLLLCELLLAELRTSDDPDLLGEVQTHVTRLLEIATQQHSHWLLAETYVLQAKLALVELNVQGARRFLDQAQRLAEERGMRKLAMQISTEHDTLLDQLGQWQAFIDRNASLAERTELAHLEEQVVRMIRKRVEKLPELQQEEPELLLIIGAESGLSVFSKSFREDQPLADQLVAGFLTAINALVRDAFAATGSIERIKHQEHTLLLKAVEPFLVSYVFQGPSYFALKKLDQFIEALQASPVVWKALTEALQTRRFVAEEGPVEALVTEMFLS